MQSDPDMMNTEFMLDQKQAGDFFSGFEIYHTNRMAAFRGFDAESGEAAEKDDPDAPLDDAARSEREYVRQRLREELQREPTEQELDEWLRQHTEGY